METDGLDRTLILDEGFESWPGITPVP